VNFKPRAEEWIRSELPGYSAKAVAEALWNHVAAGGEIDEQVETRPEWSDKYEFHHDIRIRLEGRRIYFETVLMAGKPDDPDDSSIIVVNIHDA
jgi:hypothetical protein